MRKLGILIGIIAAATLGFTGTASADGHEETLCPVVDQSAGAVLNGVGADDTAAGLSETCTTSNQDNGLLPSPTLCGLSKDAGELIDPQLGDGVDQLHGGLAEVDAGLDGTPIEGVVNFAHPCGPTTPTTTPPGGNGDDNGGGGGTEVQAANAAADGGLPRTGGELFAGAGFGLASLGALIRRFLA